MTEYSGGEPEPGQRELRTPRGQNESFACDGNGHANSFEGGSASHQEAYSGESQPTDSLGFGRVSSGMDGDLPPPPPLPNRGFVEQIPPHLLPAMKAWLQEQGVQANFPASPIQHRLAQQTIARRIEAPSQPSPGKAKSNRKSTRNSRVNLSSPYPRPVVANLAQSFA